MLPICYPDARSIRKLSVPSEVNMIQAGLDCNRAFSRWAVSRNVMNEGGTAKRSHGWAGKEPENPERNRARRESMGRFG